MCVWGGGVVGCPKTASSTFTQLLSYVKHYLHPTPNKPYGCGRFISTIGPEPKNCEKVEVDVPGSPFLIVPMVSVDVKRH